MEKDLAIKGIVRQWMTRIMAKHDLSPEAWAKKAGVAATTVTSFVNEKRDFIPSLSTLSKLAFAVGEELQLGEYQVERKKIASIPLVTFDKEGRMNTKPATQGIPSTIEDGNAFAVMVETTTMAPAGILPGDLLVCKPPKNIKAGAVVVAVTEDGTSAYHYYPPALIPTDPGSSRLEITDAKIVGVATELIRQLT